MRVSLVSFRRLVSTAHLYNQPNWSDEKNREQFGKCYSDFGHGHNYEIDFSWRMTGMTPDFRSNSYSDFLESAENTMNAICDLYDHKHLSFTHREFRIGQKISTTENLAVQIWSEFLTFWSNSSSIASPSGVLIWEMPNLASSVGITTENALARMGINQNRYVKQKRLMKGLRIASDSLPVSLEVLGPLLDLKKAESVLREKAKTSNSLPALAYEMAIELASPVLVRDLENHCAFCAP